MTHVSRRTELIEGFGTPLLCHFCGNEVTKRKGLTSDSLIVHSLDGDHENWDPTNKVAAHHGCHMTYHGILRQGYGPDRPTSPSGVSPIPGVSQYLVHYDLPADSRRKRFYRRVKRYLKMRWLDPMKWSTGSVVVTPDRDFAMFVWKAARAVGGVAHVYEATCIDPAP